MKKFTVVIEETISDKFEVFATSYKEALEIAENDYKRGKIILEPGYIQSRKMLIEEDSEKNWIEF